MKLSFIQRYVLAMVLVLMFCCGNAVASGDHERDLFIAELQKTIHCFDDGETDRAIEMIENASVTYLHTGWSYCTCGYLLSEMGEDDKAIRHFDQALETDPFYAKAWYYKGCSLSRLGRTAEAEICLLRAEELDPRYEVPWTARWPYNVILNNLVMIWLVLGFGCLGIYIVKRERLLR